VKKIQFLKAIEVDDPPSAFENLDLNSITVEDTYDGVRLGEEMTQEFIDDMIERFKNGKKIHKKYVFQIIKAVKELVYAEATMVEMEIAKDTSLTVCGDTHGQYFDLLEIFRLNGYPTDKHAYLFNGDFVDRGSWSTEIALLLYAYKWLRPDKFFLNRGNHETDDMNRVYGFEGECKAKYNEKTFKLFSESFSALPLATLIGKKYLTLHGGLFSDDKITLDDIRKLDRHAQRQPGQAGLMMEMLWTDPQPQPGRGPSKRGVGLQFGPDVTKTFCENNGLEAVIRSHEVRMEGYEEEHDGRCITGMYKAHRRRQTANDHSLLCAKILRHDRKQGCLHQHRPRLETGLPQVRCCTTSGHQAYGKHRLLHATASVRLTSQTGIRSKLLNAANDDVMALIDTTYSNVSKNSGIWS
jgi:serine/threonine-protein phosphatase 5